MSVPIPECERDARDQESTLQAPALFYQSRTKLWIRTGILLVFGTLFTLALYPDLADGKLYWPYALTTFLFCLAVGFFILRHLVPMQTHPAFGLVTLSFDRVYFPIILLLVIAKAITGRIPAAAIWADLSMCAILGLMIGRLSGICLRVHGLKEQLRQG